MPREVRSAWLSATVAPSGALSCQPPWFRCQPRGRGGSRRRTATTQAGRQGGNRRPENVRADGLGQIQIGAGVKARHPPAGLVIAREHDDANARKIGRASCRERGGMWGGGDYACGRKAEEQRAGGGC